MFSLETFDNLSNHYVSGAKKISLRTTYPKVDLKTAKIHKEKSYGNFDLHFNKVGRLIFSLHSEKQQAYKLVFGYDHQGRIKTIMKLHPLLNTLYGLEYISYNSDGKIAATVQHQYNIMKTTTVENIFSYEGDILDIAIINDSNDEEQSNFIIKYNDLNLPTEELGIHANGELFMFNRYEYIGNQLHKSISLNEDENPDATYVYFQQENGLDAGYQCVCDEGNYVRTYEYDFNSKGHWTSKVLLNDNIPKYFYERHIEYF